MTARRRLLAAAAAFVAVTAPSAAQGPAVASPSGQAKSIQAPAAPQAPTRLMSDSVADARTTVIASKLRCPVCQGLSLQDSPSELAQQMRGLIKDQVEAGKTDQEIQDYFISKYGEFILLEPRPKGFNLLAYALPGLALLGGAFLVMANVRRWTAPAGDPAAPPSDDVPPAPGD